MLDLPPPDPGIEIVLASRGISKGLVQTDGPQLLVRPEVRFGPLFVGAYAKNVTSSSSDGEAGASFGVRTGAGGFELSASATVKRLIAPVGPGDREALELAGAASREFGPVTFRAALTWSPDDLGSTGRSAYWEATTSYRLRRGWTASAALGRRERTGSADYTAFNVGVAYAVAGPFTVDLRWHDTNRSRLDDAFSGHLVASLRARF
jgi:uncharacterized protein (TIGR02001 family)